MLALLAVMTLGMAGPAMQPPAKTTADSTLTVQKAKADTNRMGKNGKSAQPTDLDVIGYLGDYGDAADGLDPMGLAEDAKASTAAPDANTKQGQHP